MNWEVNANHLFFSRVCLDLFLCAFSPPPSECCFLFIIVHVLWVVIYLYVLDLNYFCDTLWFFKIWFKNDVQDIKFVLCTVNFPSNHWWPWPKGSLMVFTYVLRLHIIWYHYVSFLVAEQFSFCIVYLIFFNLYPSASTLY